jgi:hypothetical protein
MDDRLYFATATTKDTDCNVENDLHLDMNVEMWKAWVKTYYQNVNVTRVL